MFELIRSNRRKTVVVLLLLGLLLVFVGGVGGGVLDPTLALLGMLGAFALWLILLLVSLASGEALLLRQAGAREVQRADAPQLVNVVEEMQIASGLPVAPRVFLIDHPAPNAFAVGRTPERACVAVTTGLLARLNRDELQGVIAHEVAHIANRDTLVMTLAGTTLGAIVILCDLYLRSLRFRSPVARRSSRDNNGGAALLMVLALLLAVLAPLFAQLLYFACSRKREYLADACAAQFTRYPEGLANALEKIAGGASTLPSDSRVLAPLYIVPQAASGSSGSWLATHPPTAERIKILRAMSGGSLRDYDQAFRTTRGQASPLPSAEVRAATEQPLRPANARSEPPALPPAWRAARGALHHADGAHTVDCPCGARLRIPPGLQLTSLPCPRCGHVHAVPG
jgi:heat shock protein HtpX